MSDQLSKYTVLQTYKIKTTHIWNKLILTHFTIECVKSPFYKTTKFLSTYKYKIYIINTK